MIARLTGKIIEIEGNKAILDVGGIGYEVYLAKTADFSVGKDSEVTIYIAENIKEDEYTLYGLPDKESRALYYKLTSVSGVGPKAAISILSSHEYTAIEDAIMKDDMVVFSNISGIGKKTAQRIILELKGKLVDSSRDVKEENDKAFQALISLGYSAKDARMALKDVDSNLPLQERIKLGLNGVRK